MSEVYYAKLYVLVWLLALVPSAHMRDRVIVVTLPFCYFVILSFKILKMADF